MREDVRHGIGHTFVQRIVHTQIQRSPHYPPNAVFGIEGMRIADRVLREYGAPGLLIGGLAEEIWSGSFDEADFNHHKDVDVLVLSEDCQKHPGQWESGVDWWIRHDPLESPVNGGSIAIVWALYVREGVVPSPGLYVCPLCHFRNSIWYEHQILGGKPLNDWDLVGTPIFQEFPVFNEEDLIFPGSGSSPIPTFEIATHCKPL